MSENITIVFYNPRTGVANVNPDITLAVLRRGAPHINNDGVSYTIRYCNHTTRVAFALPEETY